MIHSPTVQDRIAGCLLGGACGALGAPVEFLSDAQIHGRYGQNGITDFDHAYGLLGAITDDTQMMLCTAKGLALAAAAGTNSIASMHAAYLRWLETQRGPFRMTNMEGPLIKEPRLWATRAPGNTSYHHGCARGGGSATRMLAGLLATLPLAEWLR